MAAKRDRIAPDVVVAATVALEAVEVGVGRARIEAHAASSGMQVAGMHVDAGLSGKRADNRPALQAAIAQACKLKATLVCYSLSRLARSVVDAYTLAARLEKCGAGLVLLTESVDTTTASGRAFFGMLAVLSQFERELGSERTAGALASMRKCGQRTSRFAPFGYRHERNLLVEDAHERKTLATIKAWRKSGLTQRAIVERLNTERVPARGQRWHLRGVQLALDATA